MNLSAADLLVFRLAFSVVFLLICAVFVVIAALGLKALKLLLETIRDMLQQIQHDRLDRDATLETLRETAEALKAQTTAIAQAVQIRDEASEDRVMRELSGMGRKIDDNTEKTVEGIAVANKAADASKEAARVANDSNAKIAETNQNVVKTNERVASLIEEHKHK